MRTAPPRVARACALAVALMLCTSCTAGPPTEHNAGEATSSSCRLTPGEGEILGDVAVRSDAPSRLQLGPGQQVPATPENIALSRIGQPLIVSGTVLAADCRTPLAGAMLSVWQTTADGGYGPDSGTRTELICCYIQGGLRTDEDGHYEIRTVIPGNYADPTQQPQPAHIHFNVRYGNEAGLMTELSFSGDPYLAPDSDDIAVVAITTAAPGTTGSSRAQFDIVLNAAASP